LKSVSRGSDAVDLDESTFEEMCADCTQQSLEYGQTSTLAMNLRLLEAKLFERYIVGKKLITYDREHLLFTFAGQDNIKLYVQTINGLFAEAGHRTDADRHPEMGRAA